VVLTAGGFQFEAIDQRQRGRIGISIFDELDGKQVGGELLSVAVGVDEPGGRINLVLIEILAMPLDEAGRTGEAE